VTAVQMYDLLRDIRNALTTVPIFHDGDGQFKHIKYCTFCSYSKTHGHGENCIISRLNSALETSGEQSK
jgi:hypothetical protein